MAKGPDFDVLNHRFRRCRCSALDKGKARSLYIKRLGGKFLATEFQSEALSVGRECGAAMDKIVLPLLLLVLVLGLGAVAAQDGYGRVIPRSSGSCSVDFSKVDYSSVTSVCKGPSFATSACCSPFKTLACKYRAQVNDFETACPSYFIAFLNYAGKYPEGVFVGRCTSGEQLC